MLIPCHNSHSSPPPRQDTKRHKRMSLGKVATSIVAVLSPSKSSRFSKSSAVCSALCFLFCVFYGFILTLQARSSITPTRAACQPLNDSTDTFAVPGISPFASKRFSTSICNKILTQSTKQVQLQMLCRIYATSIFYENFNLNGS